MPRIEFTEDELRPLIRAIVAETVASFLPLLEAAGSRLAFSEADAAAMLGLEEHVLRDERRRGRITASQIVGRRIRYSRADLIEYLAGRKYAPN